MRINAFCIGLLLAACANPNSTPKTNSAPKAHAMTAPQAAATPHITQLHGNERVDNYFWLREKENPETIVEIAGHTDSRGAADNNQFLSQRRAEAVAGRLTGPLGVDPDRVSAVGYGEAEPVATNDTPAGRAQNRRVEARIQVRR